MNQVISYLSNIYDTSFHGAFQPESKCSQTVNDDCSSRSLSLFSSWTFGLCVNEAPHIFRLTTPRMIDDFSSVACP